MRSTARLPRRISARKALTETTPRKTTWLASVNVIGSASSRSTARLGSAIIATLCTEGVEQRQTVRDGYRSRL